MQVTDEMVERAQLAADELNVMVPAKAMRAALTASLSDKQAGEVKTKPLEWEGELGTEYAASILGLYSVWEGHYRPPGAHGGIQADNPKQAAQDHLERIIRSALVDVPAVEPDYWTSHNNFENMLGKGVTDEKGGVVWDFALQTWVNADVPLYTSPPLSREGEDSAEVNIPADLVKRCKEILRWHASAVLENGELRALARRIRSKLNNVIDGGESLRHAEEETKREAMRLILALAAMRSGSATTVGNIKLGSNSVDGREDRNAVVNSATTSSGTSHD